MEGLYVRSEQLENKSYIEVNELGDEFVEATTKRQTIIMNRENYEISKDDGWVIVDGKFL